MWWYVGGRDKQSVRSRHVTNLEWILDKILAFILTLVILNQASTSPGNRCCWFLETHGFPHLVSYFEIEEIPALNR